MAIDTFAKRIAALDMGNDTTAPGVPIPDGTIGAGDRMHLLWLYSGAAAASLQTGRMVSAGTRSQRISVKL